MVRREGDCLGSVQAEADAVHPLMWTSFGAL